ncbi:dTDP-4-dehydrorhamnose 3,5-epimerase [Marinomonas sp. GJ51-6]|uniref:dTDP-4-dehydrorhamnose 3,5-epimerase n=1 Tax=Marinomonas sp. GJ51-6 TaxID=2992802 RepID=UPI002934F2D7|nr:dTDP-4-dehydrorhamnose 3,5-epimerase [Marinomonas sp. GJ51-6]WOD06219.1 dTDP-4-dehydrorhamnose 3,5-epimerase [Marinomonas sp. GJ51-6]
MISLEGVSVTPLKKIHHPKGDVFHALKCTEDSFQKFGEAYFTTVHKGDLKGWKQHTKMTMNLVVPVGSVTLYFYNEKLSKGASLQCVEDNYVRVTVSPGVWMAFKGCGEGLNLMLNIASIPHDPEEAINVDIGTYPLIDGI